MKAKPLLSAACFSAAPHPQHEDVNLNNIAGPVRMNRGRRGFGRRVHGSLLPCCLRCGYGVLRWYPRCDMDLSGAFGFTPYWLVVLLHCVVTVRNSQSI